ncbi:hypothetical protein BKA61DRAFT_577534 [Leptodontidium sp. MPI-SDFR-AT-0119]|nr:hypothetical protein BKA61DRAFT_577534 [Leptodontidium sp. MPI-SDFR-AT-0119]
MNLSHDSFLDRKVAERWGPIPSEADAIRELIRGELSAEQAAKEFIKDVNASRSLDQAEMKLWRIWRLLADVTAKFPQYHDQLLDMTVAIHSLPSLQIQGEAAVKWEDLPILSQTWAETVFNWGDLANTESTNLPDHINQMAFTAKLTAKAIPGADFISHAEDDMWQAFEKTPELAHELNTMAVRSLDSNVPIAAQWVLHCGQRLSELNSEIFKRNTRLEGLWTGSSGFSRDRWEFWWRRAIWVAGLAEVKGETRECAQEMVKVMESIG